jgi:hypothetical protein
MARYATNDDLWLSATLIRQDADGDPVECDVVVNYAATMTSPGYPQTWMEPGEGPEFEIEFLSAELDGIPHDAPGPLTAIETATLRKWFEDHEGDAIERANDNFKDY